MLGIDGAFATLAAAALILGVASVARAEPSLEDRCRAEVVELHEFLEAWSNAELPDTDAAFARFADVLDASFVLIGPAGGQAGREPIVEAIRHAHGRWRDAPGRIRVENLIVRQASPELVVATYEEWHDREGASRGRLSTVVFGPDDAAPNGLVWRHLHEVWLPATAED